LKGLPCNIRGGSENKAKLNMQAKREVTSSHQAVRSQGIRDLFRVLGNLGLHAKGNLGGW